MPEGKDEMSDEKELTPEELKAELEKVQDALKRANAESADRRKQLEKIATEKAEKDKATLSDTEKLQSEIKAIKADHNDLTVQLKAERIRIAIITEATAAGFANPEHAFALIDKSEVKITDGTVSGFEKSLKALVESGALAMKDQRRGDSLGTPTGKGKPATGADQQEAPIVRF